MKRVFLFSCLCLFAIGCQKETDFSQRLAETSLEYMQASRNKGNSDSVRIERVDSISLKRKMTLKYNLFLNEVEESNLVLKNLAQIADLTGERYTANPNDSTHAQHNEALKRVREEKKSINTLLDSIKRYQTLVPLTDSTDFIGYGIEGTFFHTPLNKPTTTHPFYLFIDKNFNVVKKSDFLK